MKKQKTDFEKSLTKTQYMFWKALKLYFLRGAKEKVNFDSLEPELQQAAQDEFLEYCVKNKIY